MKLGIKISGDRAIVTNMAAFEGRIRSNAEYIVYRNGLKFFNLARMLAPIREGRLRNSISWERTADRLGITVGPNVFYDVYVEYGTGVYATGPGGSAARRIPWVYRDARTGRFYTSVGNVAQPFMTPAWRQTQPIFIRELEDMVRSELAAA